MSSRSIANALVCVASIGAAHGVRGAVKLRCFTDEAENVASYGSLLDADGKPLFTLVILGPTKGGVIAKIDGIDDRDAAEALRGVELFVPRDRLPATEPDEFYHADLIGMAVEDLQGNRLGEVCAVHDFGAGDILEYQTGTGKQEMVPFTTAHVPTIELADRRVVLGDIRSHDAPEVAS